jgi:hypothetical protein
LIRRPVSGSNSCAAAMSIANSYSAPGATATAAGIPGDRGAAQGARAFRRFHGSVDLDPARVGRDAGRIAEEVVAHLSGLVDARVRVTLDIEASIPSGAPEQVVRTVTENSRTVKFTTQGFEQE